MAVHLPFHGPFTFARDLLFSYYPTGFDSDPVTYKFLWGEQCKEYYTVPFSGWQLSLRC